LYIYEQDDAELREHEGPKVSALADPVREFRGKTWTDAEAVTTEVVAALDDMRQGGPLDDQGQPQWAAFDWTTRCQAASAAVYASAGMRIAEQEHPERSLELWTMLKRKLQAKVGTTVKVSTRTLTGFEEGLYAWLAVSQTTKTYDFGIVEMGGASTQITFPCPQCDVTNDAVKPIKLGNQTIQMYSYSFLGLGEDEAPKSLGLPASCAYGIGATQAEWTADQCASQIIIEDAEGIRDPYNMQGKQRGIHVRLPAQREAVAQWFLTGAFTYMSDNQIETCCAQHGQCYTPEVACFQAIYLRKYLHTLQVPLLAAKRQANWPQGAVICTQRNCLQQASPPPVCRWLNTGCAQS
jgi:hypothetical protein